MGELSYSQSYLGRIVDVTLHGVDVDALNTKYVFVLLSVLMN